MNSMINQIMYQLNVYIYLLIHIIHHYHFNLGWNLLPSNKMAEIFFFLLTIILKTTSIVWKMKVLSGMVYII